MQIFYINSSQKNSNYLSFKSNLPKNALKEMTISRLNATRSLYQKISEQLSRFTKEGIKNIERNLPVTLGRTLIFHECGDYKTSIAIILSNSRENDGMMRIIERKGRSKHWGDSIVINSFVLDKNNLLLKNYKENDTNTFPVDRIYLTKKEIEEDNFDKRLEGVLIDLQDKMLKLLEQLGLDKNKILKPDTAILPKDLTQIIKQIPKENQEVNVLLSSIPKKLGREVRATYPNYKFRPTTNIHTFENLGEEKVTLAYAPYTTNFTDKLSRLYVWDQYGNVKDSFTIKDDSKMVVNANRKDIRRIPRQLEYANVEEIMQDENLPSFEKYLKLYAEKLFGLRKHMIEYIKNKTEKNNFAELPKDMQNKMNDIMESINAISERFRYLPDKRILDIKQSFASLYSPPGRKGFTFSDTTTGKRVYILPLVYKNEPNLFRLTITEPDGSDKIYLVKDCKYIVKNYNPETPKKVPETLMFMNESELENLNFAKDLDFFKEQIYAYEDYVSKKFNEYLEFKSTRTSKRQ